MLQILVTFVAILIGGIAARADANEDCRRADAAYAARDVEVVIRGCSELIQLDQNNAVAYHNRGIALLRRRDPGDHQRAIADFDMAIALNPKSTTYAARGGLYRTAGVFERAIDDYTMAIQLDPKSAIAYRNRGEAYKARGEADRDRRGASAAEAYLAQREGHKLLYDEMVAELTKALEAAIADYTRAIEIDPNDADTYWLRGEASRDKYDDDQMIADHTKVLEINPRYGGDRIHVGLGGAHARRGEFDKAIGHYTKALEISPRSDQSYRQRAQAYLSAGRAAEGLPDIERSLALRPDDPLAITKRGEILEALGRMDEAIADYRRVAAKHPRSAAMNHLKRLGVLP